MSLIILVVLGFAVLLLAISLFKKLVKMAFTAILLLLLAAGIWFYLEQNPPAVPDSVRQAGEDAAGKLKEAAGELVDSAAETIKEGAEQAMDKAGEAIQEGAEQAVSKAGEALQEGADQARDKVDELTRDTSAKKDEAPGQNDNAGR